MAEIIISENDRQASLYDLSGSSLKTVFVSWDGAGNKVWVDTYDADLRPNAKLTRSSDVKTTFGWLNVEDAEMLAMSILLAVKRVRERENS